MPTYVVSAMVARSGVDSLSSHGCDVLVPSSEVEHRDDRRQADLHVVVRL
jgi:hypothetical protein